MPTLFSSMRLSLPSQRVVPLILLAVLAAAFIAIVAGRLGGGSQQTDASEVVERAFSGKTFKSGRFDASFRASIEGAPSPQLGSFEASAKGAFEGARGAPRADIDVAFSGLGSSADFGFVSTGKAAFVELGERAYRVPDEQLEQALARRPGQAEGIGSLSALGVDPRGWIEKPTNRGTARVGGVDTNHVAASINTDRFLDDVFRLASVSGQSDGAAVTEEQKGQLRQAVKAASIDVYAAKSDGTLRKLTGQISIDAPEAAEVGFSGKGTLAFDMEFSDVNEPQKITAPEDARPFGEFQQAFTSRFLGGFGDAAGDSSSGSGGSAGRASARDQTATTSPALPGAARKYLDCVQKAGTSADVQQCAPLLDE